MNTESENMNCYTPSEVSEMARMPTEAIRSELRNIEIYTNIHGVTEAAKNRNRLLNVELWKRQKPTSLTEQLDMMKRMSAVVKSDTVSSKAPERPTWIVAAAEDRVIMIDEDEVILEKDDGIAVENPLPDMANEAKTKDGKFRLAARRIMLTYKTWIDKQKICLKAAEWGPKNYNVKKTIFIAHETGTDDKITPYKHTHVCIDIKKVFKTENERYFDIEGIHPHISFILEKNWWKAVQYICKEDKEAQTMLKAHAGEMKVESIMNAESLKDAIINNMQSFNDVSGIERIYNLENKGLTRFKWEPHMPWHEEFVADFKPDGLLKYNHRRVTWIVDEKGGMGKTCLTKWLFMEHPNCWLISSDMGTSRDSATIIQNALKGGWNCHGCIINLTRTSEAQRHNRIYQYMESIKDGVMTTTKYSGTTMVFDDPHLIVFSNWYPNLLDEVGNPVLSIDRWDIRWISEDGNMFKMETNRLLEEQDRRSLYRNINSSKEECETPPVYMDDEPPYETPSGVGLYEQAHIGLGSTRFARGAPGIVTLNTYNTMPENWRVAGVEPVTKQDLKR